MSLEKAIATIKRHKITRRKRIKQYAQIIQANINQALKDYKPTIVKINKDRL